MSKYLVYLEMKPFLAQWLHHHYGNPVVFPAQSAENACIRRLLIPQPTATPVLRRGNEVAICIPDSKQKPVVTYNYGRIYREYFSPTAMERFVGKGV